MRGEGAQAGAEPLREAPAAVWQPGSAAEPPLGSLNPLLRGWASGSAGWERKPELRTTGAPPRGDRARPALLRGCSVRQQGKKNVIFFFPPPLCVWPFAPQWRVGAGMLGSCLGGAGLRGGGGCCGGCSPRGKRGLRGPQHHAATGFGGVRGASGRAARHTAGFGEPVPSARHRLRLAGQGRRWWCHRSEAGP